MVRLLSVMRFETFDRRGDINDGRVAWRRSMGAVCFVDKPLHAASPSFAPDCFCATPPLVLVSSCDGLDMRPPDSAVHGAVITHSHSQVSSGILVADDARPRELDEAPWIAERDDFRLW